MTQVPSNVTLNGEVTADPWLAPAELFCTEEEVRKVSRKLARQLLFPEKVRTASSGWIDFRNSRAPVVYREGYTVLYGVDFPDGWEGPKQAFCFHEVVPCMYHEMEIAMHRGTFDRSDWYGRFRSAILSHIPQIWFSLALLGCHESSDLLPSPADFAAAMRKLLAVVPSIIELEESGRVPGLDIRRNESPKWRWQWGKNLLRIMYRAQPMSDQQKADYYGLEPRAALELLSSWLKEDEGVIKMGASGWSYFTVWQKDIAAALRALQHAERTRLGPAAIEPLTQGDKGGTHTILDIVAGVSEREYADRDDADIGMAFAAPEEWLLETYGTTKPTRDMVDSEGFDPAEQLDRWTAVYFPVWDADNPAGDPKWWYFDGCSGD